MCVHYVFRLHMHNGWAATRYNVCGVNLMTWCVCAYWISVRIWHACLIRSFGWCGSGSGVHVISIHLSDANACWGSAWEWDGSFFLRFKIQNVCLILIFRLRRFLLLNVWRSTLLMATNKRMVGIRSINSLRNWFRLAERSHSTTCHRNRIKCFCTCSRRWREP